MSKHILITGSTDGIGKLAAEQLAKDGHHIILHGRNPEKLLATINEIKEVAQNTMIDGFVSDFSDLSSVAKLANSLLSDYEKLDVIINNAGVFKSSDTRTSNGLDIRFVVNYLAPYVLTKKLWPLLEKSETARVINLSSAAQAKVSLNALAGEGELSTQDAYAQSKLALTMWSFYLANKYPKIQTIAVNPGSLLNTKMVQEAYGQYWSPANKGADILYNLATNDLFSNAGGKYFDNDRGVFGQAHPDAYKKDKIEQLIESTEILLKDLIE